jgi:hypothetical protein
MNSQCTRLLRFRPTGSVYSGEVTTEVVLGYVLDLATGFEAIVSAEKLRHWLHRFHVVAEGDRFRGRVDPEFVRFVFDYGFLGGIRDFKLFLGGDVILHVEPPQRTLRVTLDDYDWRNLRWQIRHAGVRPRWILQHDSEQHSSAGRLE